ncbi:MAG: hypothetical protein JSV04_05130, partial [Candidatus Heimdallarchaeota archaeon]
MIEITTKTITPPLITIFFLIGTVYLLHIPITSPIFREITDTDNSRIFLNTDQLDKEYRLSSGFSLNGNHEFSQFTIEEGWIGEGTLENPYIINNLNISGGGMELTLVEIRNTDVHFFIENCIIQKGEV